MKFVAVTILSLLMLTQTFSKWIVVLDYTINKEYIAQHLCVNRNRPMLHCNGKCQLAKKLAEEEKQNNDNNTQVTAKFQEVLFTNDFNLPAIACFTISTGKKFAHYTLRSYPAPYAAIFHPPAIC